MFVRLLDSAVRWMLVIVSNLSAILSKLVSRLRDLVNYFSVVEVMEDSCWVIVRTFFLVLKFPRSLKHSAVIGQYPNVFTAAVLRNPVISAGEVSTSDIQDWYFAEFGLDYPLPSLPLGYTGLSSATTKASPSPPQIITPEVYSKLFHASPIAHVQKVTAAVLLLIGDSDQRVAPTQGIGYYHALKALRADCPDDVEMLVFGGEGHPLDGLEASKVVWLRTAEWFKYRAIY